MIRKLLYRKLYIGKRLQATENSAPTYIYSGYSAIYEENTTGTACYIHGAKGLLIVAASPKLAPIAMAGAYLGGIAVGVKLSTTALTCIGLAIPIIGVQRNKVK